METSLAGAAMKIKTRKIDLDKNLDRFEYEKVAVEAPIKVFLNGKHLATVMASPQNLAEMAFGLLVDEGVVPQPGDVVNVSIDKNEVWVESRRINLDRFKSISAGVIVTSCSSRTDFHRVIEELKMSPLPLEQRVEASDILGMAAELVKRSVTFRSTGWCALGRPIH
jgi:formate dehydrogenase accessory protein FdhD